MNIEKQMRKLLPELNKGLDDIEFYLKPECEDEWSKDYVIVEGLYYDDEKAESEYFNYAQFRYDYEQKVKSLFPECTVKFYWQSQEIEIYK